MIDPHSITNYARTTGELEEFLLFAVAVAGKRSDQTAMALERFLAGHTAPFPYIAALGTELENGLRDARLSPYTQRARSFYALARAGFDLRTVTTAELELIPGIGMKTSRFFILHSRANMECAVLDTHILSWLRDLGYEAPRSTPQHKADYRSWENVFLTECEKRGMTYAELDLQVWSERAKR